MPAMPASPPLPAGTKSSMKTPVAPLNRLTMRVVAIGPPSTRELA
jgi:hypothetical protein